MEGWHRSMTFEQTGMPWVLPSPHIRFTLHGAALSRHGHHGRTRLHFNRHRLHAPFKLAAASWIDAQALCNRLTSLSLPGIEFRPIHYKPFYALFKGENLNGVEIYVSDAEKAELTLVQFYIMQELAAMYPTLKPFANATQARLSMFDKVTGSPKVRAAFSKSYKVADMLPIWNKDADSFKARSEIYRLYE